MSESKELHEKAILIHKDLLAAHPTATARIFELLYSRIFEILSGKFSNVKDEHLVETAIDEAFLFYFDAPNKFDPNRSSLITYIYLLAKSRLLNLLKSKENYLHPKDFVELDEAQTVYSNETEEDETIEQFLINKEQDELFYEKLAVLLPDPSDQKILKLMIDGERDTDAFAAVLEISDEKPEEQRSIVKKHKDRIKIFIQRHRAEIIK